MQTRPGRETPCAVRILRNPLPFVGRVLRAFRANQGMLLSGAVAYYALLSMVPLITLLLVCLSVVLESRSLLELVSEHLELVAPGASAALVKHFAWFLEHRNAVGWVGLVVLLFFSSMAFTVLENAMSVIFFHRVQVKRRRFLISALLPYAYILFAGIGLLLMSALTSSLQALAEMRFGLFGTDIELGPAARWLIHVSGFGALILMFTSIYLVMPVGKIPLRHALVGGVTAGLLWEGARRLLLWYYASLSLVDVVYGSMATAIIVLIGLEVAAIILLLGAQVIAEYERLDRGGDCTDPLNVLALGQTHS